MVITNAQNTAFFTNYVQMVVSPGIFDPHLNTQGKMWNFKSKMNI